MSEVICPWCREMVEIPANAVITGNRCRCPKCWAFFYVACEHPVRVQQEAPDAVKTGTEDRRRLS